MDENRKTFKSTPEVLREFMPKEYERRKREGRCLHCGEKRTPSPLDRAAALKPKEERPQMHDIVQTQLAYELALGRANRAEAMLNEFADRITDDRREPDKILCHAASMRRRALDSALEAVAPALEEK